MLERQEIDALLISALYGELTPSEENRLAAHFEAHPADKTALATLTSTREAVRESRILQVQLDPPQSITTVILQEAARRAPKKKDEEREGWFARLARGFMAHPAMAAVAMLVVVLGVTTLVNSRKGDQFAEQTAPATSQIADSEKSAAGSGSATVANGVVAADQQAPQPKLDSIGGKDEYRVGLADGDVPRDPAKNVDRNVAGTETAAIADGKAAEEKKVDALRQRQEAAKAEQTKQQAQKSAGDSRDDATVVATGTKEKAAKKGTGGASGPSGSYLELRPPEAAPKDLDGAPDPAAANGRVYNYEDDLAKENVNAVTPGPSAPSMAPGATGGGGGNAGAGSGAAPRGGYAQPPATKPDPKPEAPKAGEAQTKTVTQSPAPPPRGNAATGGQAATSPTTTANNTAPRTQPAPKTPAPPPPPPAKVATNTKAPPANTTAKPADKPRAIAPAEDKSANDPQLAWAREQHMAIVAKVRAGDCKGAASIVVVLANRDFAYYRQNVATDRSVKECLAYIDNARERDTEQRAEKSRKKSINEPAPAKARPTGTAVDAAQFVK